MFGPQLVIVNGNDSANAKKAVSLAVALLCQKGSHTIQLKLVQSLIRLQRSWKVVCHGHAKFTGEEKPVAAADGIASCDPRCAARHL